MTRYLLYLCITLSGLVFNCQGYTSSNVSHVSAEKFQTLLSTDSVLIIDVRKPSEYVLGHISNAVNIDFLSDDFVEKIRKLNNQKPVLIYCHSGRRSQDSAIEFEKAGFTKIYNLEDGILDWRKESFKIVTN